MPGDGLGTGGAGGVAAMLAPSQEAEAAAVDLTVQEPSSNSSSLIESGALVLPSAAGILDDPWSFSAVHATLLFVDLTLDLIEVPGSCSDAPLMQSLLSMESVLDGLLNLDNGCRRPRGALRR